MAKQKKYIEGGTTGGILSTYKCRIRGTAPLLMHNARLSDPLNPFARALGELTSKKKKTESIHLEIQKREFLGGLYYSESLRRPYIPGDNLTKMLVEGAKSEKLGKAATAAVMVADVENVLDYDGPTDIEGLYEQGFWLRLTAKNPGSSARVCRTRPKFDHWEVGFSFLANPDAMAPEAIRRALEHAGLMVGLCDYRPRYGRFEVVSFEGA